MKITSEKSIRDFEFWSGGADRANDVKCDEDWDAIESCVEELYPDGIDETTLNDLFWFDFDILAKACGYEDEEHYFYGAAKDEDEMIDVLEHYFPDINEDVLRTWVSDCWRAQMSENACCEAFNDWYEDNYSDDVEYWVDKVYERCSGTIAQMKYFMRDKDITEKSDDEWLDEFEEWWDVYGDEIDGFDN